jgi:predicted nuclease of predicted toxin-antitoxin system
MQHLKIDENLGNRGVALLRAAGHDVATVYEQKLASSSDDNLLEVCRKESRCLVTLDKDFSNPFLYDPAKYAGIAVLRPSDNPKEMEIRQALEILIARLATSEISGKLWIVEKHRIREYSPNR